MGSVEMSGGISYKEPPPDILVTVTPAYLFGGTHHQMPRLLRLLFMDPSYDINRTCDSALSSRPGQKNMSILIYRVQRHS